jgi:acyl-CoA thioesterase-1
MGPLVIFFAGGTAFLVGAVVVTVAVTLRAAIRRRWAAALGAGLSLLGTAAVALSATALPVWLYAVWGIPLTAWLFMPARGKRGRARAIATEGALLLLTICAVGFELPFELRPQISPAHYSRLYVVGDSITAGIGREGGHTWPTILQTEHHVNVVDLSHAGFGCAEELRRIRNVPLSGGLVLLEIGGNDLLGRVPPSQFGQDLDALVRHLSGPDRQLVMFELPLFPFDNAYGREQRRIARERHVVLVPKRFFANVLASSGATVDGIHLSETGQRQMAQMVWDLLGDRLSDDPSATSRPWASQRAIARSAI